MFKRVWIEVKRFVVTILKTIWCIFREIGIMWFAIFVLTFGYVLRKASHLTLPSSDPAEIKFKMFVVLISLYVFIAIVVCTIMNIREEYYPEEDEDDDGEEEEEFIEGADEEEKKEEGKERDSKE